MPCCMHMQFDQKLHAHEINLCMQLYIKMGVFQYVCMSGMRSYEMRVHNWIDTVVLKDKDPVKFSFVYFGISFV